MIALRCCETGAAGALVALFRGQLFLQFDQFCPRSAKLFKCLLNDLADGRFFGPRCGPNLAESPFEIGFGRGHLARGSLDLRQNLGLLHPASVRRLSPTGRRNSTLSSRRLTRSSGYLWATM